MKAKILEEKLNQMREGITFDDILLLPNYTDFKRREVDLTTKLHPKIVLKLPIISSPMDTVTEEEMAIEMARNGGLGIIHRNLRIERQAEMIKKVKSSKLKVQSWIRPAVDEKGRLLVGAALGAGADFEKRLKAVVKAGVNLVVLDSGHGYSKFIIEALRFIKKNYPDLPVMAGNVATFEGAKALIENGADILRVGMGPGSICTTRIVTGMGVPQLTAVSQAIKAAEGTKATIVADGGIRQPGDIAKALAFGADAVMLGSLLAGTKEAPGEVIKIGDKLFKEYRGMGSIKSMKKGGAERYGQKKETDEKKLIAEGVEGLVPYKGPVGDLLYQLAGSLRSSFYYIGAKNLKEFFKKAKFIKISRAGLFESHPHSIKVVDGGRNYLS